MPRMIGSGLSRREREIVDILYRRGQATAAEVLDAMPEAPTYSAVRSTLRILEEKGHVRHLEDGKRYVYSPSEPSGKAARSAITSVIATFFGGSLEQAVKTFLSEQDSRLSDQEYDSLATLIEHARTASKNSGAGQEDA